MVPKDESVTESTDAVETTGDINSIDLGLKNIKSEFSRKMENMSTVLEQQNKQIEALLGQMQSKNATVTESVDENIGDLIYQDPNAAINKIVDKVTKQVDSRNQTLVAAQNTVSRLQGEYPELADQRTNAYKVAEKYYDQLPSNLKGTAEGAEIALMRAVREEGLIPKSKRERVNGEDDFSLDGTGARKANNGKPARGKATEIDPATLGFAQLMGKNIKDPKYVERLKKEASRDNWNKWQTVEGEE